MHRLLRAKFKKDIIAEFLPPVRDRGRAIIFCGGLPAAPSKWALLNFYARKNYWVFEPRYRGTWESDGTFLSHDPTKDIADVAESLKYGFTSLWDGRRYRPKLRETWLCGSSFGGAVALSLAGHKNISGVIALSPVVDWRAERQTEESPRWLGTFLRHAYPGAYRFRETGWRKLERGKFANPVNHITEIDTEKIYVIHAKDDSVVSLPAVKKFAKRAKCKFTLLARGGHMSLSVLARPAFYKRASSFFDGVRRQQQN